jgi:spore germination cell wall hydrolase CwlJ-like protein
MGVCLKPKQFSCWNDDDPNADIIRAVTTDNGRYRRSLGVVALVLYGDIPDPTDGATHYHTADRPAGVSTWPPVWAKAMKVTALVGAHVFLREFRGGELA